jgi:hypothetical protein
LWARSATDVLLRSSSIAVNNQARYLLGKENVVRIDPRVPAADVSIDSLSGLDALVARARHHSRHIMPDVHRQFVGHRAPTFTPRGDLPKLLDDPNQLMELEMPWEG